MSDSLQGPTIAMAMNSLDSLKTGLYGIQKTEETEEELDGISKHILALEGILKGYKKSVHPISTVFCVIINDVTECDFLNH